MVLALDRLILEVQAAMPCYGEYWQEVGCGSLFTQPTTIRFCPAHEARAKLVEEEQ